MKLTFIRKGVAGCDVSSVIKKSLCGAILLVCVPFATRAQDAEVSVGADLVSSYVWRGQELGGVSIQPSLSIEKSGLSIGAWGSVGFDSADTHEFDLTAGYTVGKLSVGVTDYWFDRDSDGIKQKYGNYSGAHVFEGTVRFDFGAAALSWNTNFAGADGVNDKGERAYSSYVELSAPFKVGGVDFSAEVGASPWETDFYGVSGFSVINIGVGASKDLKVSETFTIPAFAKININPQSEGAYFVFGLSF